MVEFPTGLLFAVAGMLGAPVGSWLADQIPQAVLLSLFAMLMLVIAVRLWTKSRDAIARLPIIMADQSGPTCRRDSEGKLRITSTCAVEKLSKTSPGHGAHFLAFGGANSPYNLYGSPTATRFPSCGGTS